MASVVIAIIFCILQFITFLFTLVGTPLGQYQAKGSINSIADFFNTGCITMWGRKTRCRDTKNLSYPYACDKDATAMRAARAFAIISIIVTLITLILGFLLALKTVGVKFIPAIFAIIGMITLLITWTCVAGVFHHKCMGTKLSKTYNLSAGFGLIVTAWCLQFINMILAFFA